MANQTDQQLRLPDAPKPNGEPFILRLIPIPSVSVGALRLHKQLNRPGRPRSVPRPVKAHRRTKPHPPVRLLNALLINATAPIHVRQPLLGSRLRNRLPRPEEARVHAETAERQVR